MITRATRYILDSKSGGPAMAHRDRLLPFIRVRAMCFFGILLVSLMLLTVNLVCGPIVLRNLNRWGVYCEHGSVRSQVRSNASVLASGPPTISLVYSVWSFHAEFAGFEVGGGKLVDGRFVSPMLVVGIPLWFIAGTSGLLLIWETVNVRKCKRDMRLS